MQGDGTSQQSPPATSRTDTEARKDREHTAHDKFKHSSEAQQEPQTPSSSTATSSSSSTETNTTAAARVKPPGRVLQNVKKEQEDIGLNAGGLPRFPSRKDFSGLPIKILERVIDVDVKNCVIMMHDKIKAEPPLYELALRLQRVLPESVFLLLGTLQASSSNGKGRNLTDLREVDDSEDDRGFPRQSRTILLDVIKHNLIGKFRFSPRNIIILGHRQGGTDALAAVALWENIEFGGVISIGGTMPALNPLNPIIKAKTPALIIGGELGGIKESDLPQIREHFTDVESDFRRTSNDDLPEAEDIGILLEFFAHRLRGEEWTKQAVISFDGGGIRGYGSLLILQALMNKIGEEEKRLNSQVQSSFEPKEYKPMSKKISGGSDGPKEDDIVATSTEGLPNSSLFLPCHYFTYAAGTSTGGLISIMLSRFRMSVDDCIKEYKALGAKVFGNPRPLAKGAILWHKFDCRTLEAAIIDVTQRHCQPGDFGDYYPMDEDVCKCIVLAYADSGETDYAYPFRTYQTRRPLRRSRSQAHHGGIGTYGDAPKLPIYKVARATSAAPTYFSPITIERGSAEGAITFKDGGFGSNNPSLQAYNDVIEIHGGTKERSMGPFISIGTGVSPVERFSKKKGPFGHIYNAIANFKGATQVTSMTLGVHELMAGFSMSGNKECFPYFRFDGGTRLKEIAMDEWKSNRLTRLTGHKRTAGGITLERIFVATAVYLADPKVQQDLAECARILVRRRQLRMRNSSEWDRYASFSYYDCNVEGCAKQRSNKAQEFREHLRTSHQKIANQDMDQKVKDCRHIYWLYRPSPPGPIPSA
ncbi:acyl transferase/acyl hydrolase/lysophospholipase [Usnea florida]